jgi:hypothetical protein
LPRTRGSGLGRFADGRCPTSRQDEVLARLLELNNRRAEMEARAGAAEQLKKGGRRRPARQPPETGGLY